MAKKPRTASDSICRSFLKSLRFRPTSTRDSYTSGVHRVGAGFGGVGYSYWTDQESLALHMRLGEIRDVIKVDISIEETKKFFSDYCSKYINPVIAGRFDWQVGGGDFFEKITPHQRQALEENFFTFLTCFIREKWHWVPINSVLGENYRDENLIISDLPSSDKITPEQMADFVAKPVFASATKYFALKARNHEHAKEKIGIVLGALFLCMHSGTHFLHTMGKPATGFLTFEGGMTVHSTRAHIPYLANPISLTAQDFPFLNRVAGFLEGRSCDRKLIRSLRWLSAAWFAVGAERFSLICQSVDAVTPSALNTMRAKCDWMHDQLDAKVSKVAIEFLFKRIRGDIAHGDAPSLIESHAYLEFLEKYGVEPGLAAIEVVRDILVRKFVPEVILRPNPVLGYPDYMEQQRKIFGRYGLEFVISEGFDFSQISE